MEIIKEAPDIWFPNLGIEIGKVNKIAFSDVFGTGIDIYWYGIMIMAGVLIGYLIVMREAVKTGQKKDVYSDFLLYAVIFCTIGARLYYVIFKWDYFKDNILEVFALRKGGIAIYGAVIAAVITSFVYTKIKKINFFKFADTAVLGLIIGQAVGRWGNFINREAFGGYTESIFAMRYKVDHIKETSSEVLSNLKEFAIDGTGEIVKYVQVHPTFLYESIWNFVLFILLNIYKKHKKFEGELTALYFIGYGTGRFWIEGLRTDQLIIGNTGIAASQALSLFLIAISAAFIAYIRYREKGKFKMKM